MLFVFIKLGTININKNMEAITYTPISPALLPTLPIIMPKRAKSASPKVVFANPKFPKTGSSNAGKKDIKIPLIKEPIMQPLIPPFLLA